MVIILAKGHLELRNTNKIMYICVVLPTVAKASRDGIVVASNVRLLCQTTSNCKYALSNDICFFSRLYFFVIHKAQLYTCAASKGRWGTGASSYNQY
jgi:hypothetical protein